jgi:hypothetical protein
LFSPPPTPPPQSVTRSPPPTSVEGLVAEAEAKTAEAELARELLLGDIGDEKAKVKAKLLADAAIAGVKVTKVTMALTAESDDAACAQAFSKMQVDASLGLVCDVAFASVRRRRLVGEATYNITLIVSPVTLDATTLAAALANLAAEGVTATTTETNPIEELRDIPGIDATLVDLFALDAAVASEATFAANQAVMSIPPPSPPPPSPLPPSPPPSPPPPPPPSPPPLPPPPSPVLVADDESTATRLELMSSAKTTFATIAVFMVASL